MKKGWGAGWMMMRRTMCSVYVRVCVRIALVGGDKERQSGSMLACNACYTTPDRPLVYEQ